MMKEHRQDDGRKALRTTDWADAEIVTEIRYTKPGTPLDELLRKRQTAVLLELLGMEQQTAPRPGSGDPS
jgi:hypothetical protein